VVSFEYAELTSSQQGEVVGRVPAEWLEPYMHQRYDDLSVLGAKR
jgi:acetoacetate decarboxylase